MSSKSTSGRVLVVDDEPMLRAAFLRALAPRHDVIEAAGGAEALEHIERGGPFDVVLCDVMMPDVDGPAVYEATRDRHPSLLERFVFLTGGVFTARTRDFLASVRALVLEKPVSVDLLLAVIDQVAAGPAAG